MHHGREKLGERKDTKEERPVTSLGSTRPWTGRSNEG